MWEIWANELLPKALKTCQKSKKSPNLVTLPAIDIHNITFTQFNTHLGQEPNVKCIHLQSYIAGFESFFII